MEELDQVKGKEIQGTKKATQLGKLVSNLLPIALVLSVIWVIFLIIWMMLGIPIGPGVTTFLQN